MAWDKDKPAASTSLRNSNPEILANNSALEDALGNEHEFSTGGANSGDHIQGSARCFSQASAPTTRIDGSGFAATDLGSLWVDTDDNALYILTATVPTWTPVSTEVISTLLGSARTFLDTLGCIGNFDVNTNKFTVNATNGNTAVAGTLDIASTIPITATLDEDDMTSDSATAVSTQQSIKKYVDDNVGSANWDPTTYIGGQSATFPNGLIMKFGEASVGTNTTLDVVYDDAFTAAFVWAMVSYKGADVASDQNAEVRPKSGNELTTLQITNGETVRTLYWMAIGR